MKCSHMHRVRWSVEAQSTQDSLSSVCVCLGVGEAGGWAGLNMKKQNVGGGYIVGSCSHTDTHTHTHNL